ncbi:hypothetical protein C5167_026589 [Papaver somniferum]|uniref:uncharacterized protein At1g01500-like n=1 Tax=Papaver somniferum TaxID=3469 RepID=UPI000E6FB81F|nr:uncharacterized protein At1g01500-like [Papaver somniferum]RZC85917.1 hypothetical protein C5167_026589 [Papaver somniferum]
MEVENYPTRDHHHHPHHLSHLNVHHHHKIISSSSTKDLTFEIKVTYMRIISSSISNIMKKTSSTSSSSSMNLVFLPRELHSCLQINGLKINPSDKISRPLNKHRSDSLMSELMYVNTDRIKFKGFSLPFEIVLQHQEAASTSSSSVVVSGSLRRKVSGMKDDCMWVMECKELSNDSKLTSGGGGSVDVYFAGRSLGKPLLLNGLVELKNSYKELDFLEDEFQDGGELGLLDTSSKEKVGEKAIQEFVDAHKYNNNKHHDHQNHYGEEEKFVVEEEEEEVSWFNQGVRVGIGLGMGMCLGVGVGLGLVVKTYKKTSGTFTKFLFRG